MSNHRWVVCKSRSIMSAIVRFIGHADVSVFYLFLRKKLDWDMEHYTLYKTVRELLRILVTVASVSILHKMMRIKEAPLILLASVITFGSMLLQAWATVDWHIYLGIYIYIYLSTYLLTLRV